MRQVVDRLNLGSVSPGQDVVQFVAFPMAAGDYAQASILARGVRQVVRQEDAYRPGRRGLGALPFHEVLMPVEGWAVSGLGQDDYGVVRYEILEPNLSAGFELRRLIDDLLGDRIGKPILGCRPSLTPSAFRADEDIAALVPDLVGNCHAFEDAVGPCPEPVQQVRIHHTRYNGVTQLDQLPPLYQRLLTRHVSILSIIGGMVNGEKPLLFDSAQQNRLLRDGV